MKTLLSLICVIFFNITLYAQEVPVGIGGTPMTTSIAWKWFNSLGATGYKWSATNSYSSATENATDTTAEETGLTPNTEYTRYVWAYNTCGHSSPEIITQTTLDDFLCGATVTVNHSEGTTNPVTKSVVYSTASLVDLCWITRNLGATRQALSFADSTEASAGWYWQFNRKQGYKYGASRIPYTAWITSISENKDWESGNDPCSELGLGWRIPTRTEFTSLGFSTGNAAYSSTLKLHAGGYLDYTSGAITGRGGAIPKLNYWTGTSYENSNGYKYYGLSNGVGLSFAEKANATPIRCVKEVESGGGCTSEPLSPAAATHTAASTSVIWKWNASEEATGYKFNTINSYASATDLGNVTTRTETGLTCNTAYTRYVWAYNDCGQSAVRSLSKSTINDSPPAPAEGSHVATEGQILWVWGTVGGATGYKWNTVNTYGSATDMGTGTQKTESGLSPRTTYTRYVWAYNTCGASEALPLTGTTLAVGGFTCTGTITVQHTAGATSPVTKEVVYGVVTNIPGATSKCWIDRNLGAGRVATAKNDVSEQSAGWYWQFNRLQGYKHSGTSRTPSAAWITTAGTSSDWTEANDPCVMIGDGWRIPTATEWTNVDAGWTSLNHTWNSALKLHPAGYLQTSSGALINRGTYGNYWSSTRYNSANGYHLSFYSGESVVKNSSKNFGFTIRCIHD